jgi:hypothetical protein
VVVHKPASLLVGENHAKIEDHNAREQKNELKQKKN